LESIPTLAEECPKPKVEGGWRSNEGGHPNEDQPLSAAGDGRADLGLPGCAAAVAFLVDAFGFVERTRSGRLTEPKWPWTATGRDRGRCGRRPVPPQPGVVTHMVRIRVADVDGAFIRARAAGAVVVEAPVDREYGERDCTVQDLAGHHWQLAEALSDVVPEEFGCLTVSPWPGYDA